MPARFLFPIFLGIPFPAFAQRTTPEESAAKWEPALAAFESTDHASPPPPSPVLFTGSSSIRQWKLDASWPGRVDLLNRGFGGSTLADCIHLFDRLVTPYRPSGIVLYSGDNDIGKGMTADEVVADFATLAARLQTDLPGTPLLYVAIKPSRKRWERWPVMDEANRVIAAICAASPTLEFADIATPMLHGADGPPPADLFAADGLHLSPRGYALWQGVVQPWLDRVTAP